MITNGTVIRADSASTLRDRNPRVRPIGATFVNRSVTILPSPIPHLAVAIRRPMAGFGIVAINPVPFRREQIDRKEPLMPTVSSRSPVDENVRRVERQMIHEAGEGGARPIFPKVFRQKLNALRRDVDHHDRP